MNSFLIYVLYILAFYLVVTLILQTIFWSVNKIWSYLYPLFNSHKVLSDEVLNKIEDEAMDMVWKLHRVGNEPHLTEYYDFYRYIYEQRYDALMKEIKT